MINSHPQSPTQGPSGHLPTADQDDALVAALLRGDERAAGAAYDRLNPIVRQTLRRVLRGRWQDLEDLVQLTFEHILRGLAADRFHGRSKLTTWAAGIAAHVALDALRKQVRGERRLSLLPLREAPTAQGQLEARSELRRLHHVLSRMKPTLAEVLVLHDVLGHDLNEVAEQLQVSHCAAQSRLFRARKDLLRRTVNQGGNA